MKPAYLKKPSSLNVYKNNTSSPQQPSIIYLDIYEEAKAKKHWIYDPDIKRWQSPEEFLELEKRISGGESNRLARLQVKDPMEGIEVGYLQMQVLKERMEIFVKRVVEYYKKYLHDL